MAAVLVSGAKEHVAQVAAALRARGASVTEVVDLDQVPAVCAATGRDGFDSYVQLPATFEVQGATAVQRVHHFYADGVLARFVALDGALPSLTSNARVTFVLGHLPDAVATSDDRQARRSLTKVLAHAARADTPDGRLVVQILDSGTSPEEISRVALGEHMAKQELMDRLDAEPNYSNWRVELWSLDSMET